MASVCLCVGALVFLNLFVCCNFYTKDTVPGIEDQRFIEECVRVHNNFRSNVNPPASNMKRMSWDHQLAIIAKDWAKNCQFVHNPDLMVPHKAHSQFANVGENIWAGSLTSFNVTLALTNWFDETSSYEYDTQKCDKICGHYTQMVWATSYRVGCAAQFCPKLQNYTGSDAVLFICDYGPAGNFPTQPYKTGEPCSQCGRKACHDKLCDADGSKSFYINPFLLLMTTAVILLRSITPE
nr:glioma pathogenesis-related protein 1-like [Pogona vitticeps]XP_020660058.1 glioma pathogenesis-related protein 1-like [Pogona vitticeps]XP_020660066.1 glioma pathogenesis-related protein 1-like [Pogona vitticeps]